MPNAMLELVDTAGVAHGTAEKIAAHEAPGLLHRAFSVFLFDESGRMALQRRAAGKYHWPGVLSNACCGHPSPGEDPKAAAECRVHEELGVHVELTPAGTVTYRHADAQTGLVEHEFNHLFVGRISGEPQPNPDEVSEVRMVTAAELTQLLETHAFSGWFLTVLQAARVAFAQFTHDIY